MPIVLVDDDGKPVDLDKASGSFLRTTLEEALERNKALEQIATTAAATTALSGDSYGLVKPEDLVGVPPEQVEAKAKELQEQRLETRTLAVRSVLEERGLEGEELETTLKGVIGNAEQTSEADKNPGFAGLGSLGGVKPPNKGEFLPMEDSMGNMTEHFEEASSKK